MMPDPLPPLPQGLKRSRDESCRDVETVAFKLSEAATLWGESAEPNQRVFLDLWESYLAPGAGGAAGLSVL